MKKCGIILVDMNNPCVKKILIVFSRKSKKYGFPKGGQEENEKWENTAIRELKEETGYQLKSENLLQDAKRFLISNNVYFILPFYNSRNNVVEEGPILDRKEILYKKWMSIEELETIKSEHFNLGLRHFMKSKDYLLPKQKRLLR